MLDSSENFNNDEFFAMRESVAALVDESFDLAPDVVRVGFIIYRFAFSFHLQLAYIHFSDKVAVPVALGHYEERVELIEKISSANKMNDGVAIALYGMNAARQQFQLHGRQNASRIVIMITNGKNRCMTIKKCFNRLLRGNAATAAAELRDTYNVELFVLAVRSDASQLASLKRVAGIFLYSIFLN